VRALSDKLLVKSWLHEIKYIRNEWAHSSSMEGKLVARLFDTGQLLFLKLNANLEDPLFQRLALFRGHLVLREARELHSSGRFG
jgi:hypothetical protein